MPCEREPSTGNATPDLGAGAGNPSPAGGRRLIIFLRAPRPGSTKTRLAQTLGAERATQAYVTLVQHLLASLGELEEVELRYTPDDGRAEIAAWARPGWLAKAQGGGDLGERMERAFGEAFAQGLSRVVLIGSDCPRITPEDIRRAWNALGQADLVLGPARDGGYWLIGLRTACPALWRGMVWSTSQVLKETVRRAEEAGLKAELLRELLDIDTEADWRDYVESLGQGWSAAE